MSNHITGFRVNALIPSQAAPQRYADDSSNRCFPPSYRSTAWRIGSEVTLQARNLLLIGNNGSGKTSLLTLLQKGIRHHANSRSPSAPAPLLKRDRSYDSWFLKSADWPKELWEDAMLEGWLIKTLGWHSPDFWDQTPNMRSSFTFPKSAERVIQAYAARHGIDSEIIKANILAIECGFFETISTAFSKKGPVSISTSEGRYIDPKHLIVNYFVPPKDESASFSSRDRQPAPLSAGETRLNELKDIYAKVAGETHRILLLDEPTAPLSPTNAQETFEALTETGAQVIATSHDARYIQRAEEHADWDVFSLDTMSHTKKAANRKAKK